MIRKLPPHLVQQIAAGEVIERPASALKELLENSLDAGADQIRVFFEEGGLKSLIIEDNGSGISEADLPLAFEAHATGKIERIEDFDRLATFGFRGEALAALAAVGDLRLWTSTVDDNLGRCIRRTFGDDLIYSTADRRQGTEVQVLDLYARHPVRIKFLKSIQAEARALWQVWRRYALAYPHVYFSMEDRTKNRRETIGPQSLFERALWYFDATQPHQWFETSEDRNDNLKTDPWAVRVISKQPRYFTSGRAHLLIYLNKRPIKDMKLEFAMRRAFEGFTETPHRMEAALYIEGSPALFDVNVHPTKQEVRFQQGDELFSKIVRVVRAHLEGLHRDIPVREAREVPSFEGEGIEERFSTFEFGQSRERISSLMSVSEKSFAEVEPAPTLLTHQGTSRSLFHEVATFRYMGSIDETYLVAEKNRALYLFDQHALHERILYEKLKKDYEHSERLACQRLLFPLQMGRHVADKLLIHEELLKKLGFEIRAWSEGRVQILSAPALLKRGIENVLEKFMECAAGSTEMIIREVLASMACHGAVRAHDRLEREEVERLFRDFQTDDALGHCPHGRPTYVQFDPTTLEKLFHRVL